MTRLRSIATALALTLLGFAASAGDFTDSAGRTVTFPDKVERVFAAGPPASIVVFTSALRAIRAQDPLKGPIGPATS